MCNETIFINKAVVFNRDLDLKESFQPGTSVDLQKTYVNEYDCCSHLSKKNAVFPVEQCGLRGYLNIATEGMTKLYDNDEWCSLVLLDEFDRYSYEDPVLADCFTCYVKANDLKRFLG